MSTWFCSIALRNSHDTEDHSVNSIYEQLRGILYQLQIRAEKINPPQQNKVWAALCFAWIHDMHGTVRRLIQYFANLNKELCKIYEQ